MGFLGAAAVGAGGQYLQKRAQNKAVEQSNALIQQQTGQNNALAYQYMQSQQAAKSRFLSDAQQIKASAQRAKKQIGKTLPFPNKSATQVGSPMGYASPIRSPGRGMLVGM